jgi:hypothetical protein
MFRLQPDAHQFVVTARVRASEILARTGVGRVCTVDEMRPPATITFNYPSKFQNLIPDGQQARHKRTGLTARSVAFSTVPAPQGGMYGHVVFTDGGATHEFTLRPELGADALGHQVVEFMANGKSPTFPPEMVI